MKASTLIDMAGVANAADAKVKSLGSQASKKAKTEEKDVKDTKKLAEIITSLQAQLDELSDAVTSSPIAAGILFDNVPCTSGYPVRLRHNFSRRARWAVINWAGAFGYEFVEDAETNISTLVLVAAVTGTVSLWVT